jgi:archaellum component FlaG (FlaF/FlaG flagellin family)
MKKIITSSLLILGLITFAKAQTADNKDAAPNPNQAEITFEKDIHDFGTIEYGGNGTYEFKFKNTGKEPLIISNAKGSCGCTVPTYPKDTPIKPGEANIIKVTYDTKRSGAFTKTVTINSNAKTAEKIITIKGTVNPAPVDEPFPSNGKKENGAVPFEKN